MAEEQSYCRPDEPRPERKERVVPAVGNTISWSTLGGERHRGKVVEMDSNVAHVLCDDGVKRCVEC